MIQPFDGGPFDKRFEDVFVPAISAAGLEPYRVDRDPTVVIPIDQIEKGIRGADVCLADISTANPNVWFELGYAIAAGKPVVLVCEFEKDKRFPFDIQHRAVVTYRTESPSDFTNLSQQITARLSAALLKEERLERLAESAVVAEVEGLSSLEIVALVAATENSDAPDYPVSAWTIRHDMERSGYTKIGTTIGLTSLIRKGMLEAIREVDINGNPEASYRPTPLGLQWLLDHQDKLVLHKPHKTRESDDLLDADIPF
ncbi:MAG: hypothetical protein WD690_19080 [Vicinamibacterales bacterium]